jgi:hypothetical protein
MDKFKFDKDFQWSIIRYTIKDKQGYKALLLYKPTYFILIDQQIIAKGLHRYFKRKKRVPMSSAVLNEELNTLFKTKEYAQTILEIDRDRIKHRVRKIYKSVVTDGDEIIEKCKLFASYVEVKGTLEDVNLEDFQSYPILLKKLQKGINIGMEIEDNKGRFLVAGHQDRILQRYNIEEIIPTPFRQINNLTNAGGWTKGSLIVVVDTPKRGKTWMLSNVATAYMRKRGIHNKIDSKNKEQKAAKKIIYFDLENGETAIEVRFDQQLLNKSKLEILQHTHDDRLKKIYRQFRRMQGEIYTRRMPWGSTTDDFQRVLDEIYAEFGIKFEVAIVDYAAIMGSCAKDKEDFQRISNIYLDLKNWALLNNFDAVWTAHHVKREAYKRRYTKYQPDDLAKCIDIERHVDAVMGIQQSKLEEEGNVFRVEMITQRDGDPWGRALFWANRKSQRLTEFVKEEEIKYNEELDNHNGVEHKETIKSKEERVKSKYNDL